MNELGLLSTLRRLEKQLPWEEELVIINSGDGQEVDVHDDHKRELYFYEQAFSSVLDAVDRMDAADMSYRRPRDYYAEMIKTDAHMNKVKRKLLVEQEKIEAVDRTRQQIMQIKHAKQLKASMAENASKKKKATLNAISELRKNKVGSKRAIDTVLNRVDKSTKGKDPKKFVGGKYKKAKSPAKRPGKNRRK